MTRPVIAVLMDYVAGGSEGSFSSRPHYALRLGYFAAIEAAGVFLIRPASLTLRLFGNINGDHMVFGIMSDLVPVVVPSIFLALGIWVSFLQAFVFTLLSAIYIMLSVGHDDEEGHH